MNKVYHLGNCGTCQTILANIPNLDKLEKIEIKSTPLTKEALEEMYALSGSYEKLFSKRALLYKSLDLKNKNLKEKDFKKYMLEHYTFLARPVFIINGEIFIGNGKNNVLAVQAAMAAL